MDPTIWSVASSFTVWHVQDDIYVELPPIRPKNNAELFTFNGYRNNMLISYIVSREREKNCVPGDITYQIKDTPWPFRFEIPIFRYQSHPKVVLDFYECLNKKKSHKKPLAKEGRYWWREKEEDGSIWKRESHDAKRHPKERTVPVICDSRRRKPDTVENILVKNMIFLLLNDGFCEWNGYQN